MIFYALNLLLLCSCVLPFFLKSNKHLYSFSLIQILLNLPLLAGVYFYFSCHMVPHNLPLLLFFENIFALIWFYAAHRITRSITTTVQGSRISFLIQICAGIIIVLAAVYSFFYHSVSSESINILSFDNYGIVYFSTLFLLLSTLSAAWSMEKLWRALVPARRWEYKFLLIGKFLICGSIVWSTSYRLTYERFISKAGFAHNPSSIYPQITQINAEYLCNLRNLWINDLKNFLFFMTGFQA